MSDVQEDVKAVLKEGQEFVVIFNGNAANLDSDPRILRNIMFNLISNASKYSGPHKKITLYCSGLGDQIIFKVEDEGIGIPPEDQKHLFERFFRASNSGNIEGTGLGLNIVKRYTELLNGGITFNSEYGKGSTFIVSIPLAVK
jgi:signal transduction histidine kinase